MGRLLTTLLLACSMVLPSGTSATAVRAVYLNVAVLVVDQQVIFGKSFGPFANKQECGEAAGAVFEEFQKLPPNFRVLGMTCRAAGIEA